MQNNPMLFYKRMRTILSDFGLQYFQDIENSSGFPSDFFNTLIELDMLTYNLSGDDSSFVEFAMVCELIGEVSISASICWGMHNQQFECLRRTKKLHLVDSRRLLASVTTQPNASAELTKVKFNLTSKEPGLYSFYREAPIVSFGHLADDFVVSLASSENKHDVWLCLLDRSHIRTCKHSERVNSCRSTQNQTMVFEGQIGQERLLCPLNDVLKSFFAPMAHIAWGSAYTGGVNGVVKRYRAMLRMKKSVRGAQWNDRLLTHRIGSVLAILDGCKSFIYQCASWLDQDVASQYSRNFNSLKFIYSSQLAHAVEILKDELGISFTIMSCDELGFEVVRRDIDCAKSMFHNDKILEFIYNDWFLYGDNNERYGI